MAEQSLPPSSINTSYTAEKKNLLLLKLPHQCSEIKIVIFHLYFTLHSKEWGDGAVFSFHSRHWVHPASCLLTLLPVNRLEQLFCGIYLFFFNAAAETEVICMMPCNSACSAGWYAIACSLTLCSRDQFKPMSSSSEVRHVSEAKHYLTAMLHLLRVLSIIPDCISNILAAW